MKALQNLSNAFKSIAEALSDTFENFVKTVLSPPETIPDVHMGEKVIALHESLGVVKGHVCEYRSDNTVTIARQSDGVLVHLHRNTIRKQESRD